MPLSLNGKRALVTGSSRGIGAAIARALSKEGATVVVNYRSSESEARAVASSITRSEGKALVVKADVADAGEVDSMFDRIYEKLGGLDILVNNAGLADSSIWNANLDQVTPEMWQKVVSVDLAGTFMCSRRAAGMMGKGAGLSTSHRPRS